MRLWWNKYSKKYQSDNIIKTKSQDFRGNKYSKNINGLGGVRNVIF